MQYTELQVTSNFSFLRGASNPQDLIEQAASFEYDAIAITDRNTVAGMVRAHVAAKEKGIRLIPGVHLVLLDDPELLAYPTDRAAWSQLMNLLTTGNLRTEKGDCHLYRADVYQYAEGVQFIVLPPAVLNDEFAFDPAFEMRLSENREALSKALYIAAMRRYMGDDTKYLHRVAELSKRYGIPMVATNDVYYHTSAQRQMQDMLTCIREKCTIYTAGYKLHPNMIFSNPFHCGIIADKMLNGKLVEGSHEKMITPEVFLQVHNVRAAAKGKYGVTHKKENEQYPLKLFMKCDKCGNGYTGYVVKKKNKTNSKVHEFHYYKCRSQGCNCNQSTTEVNQEFIYFLKDYTLQPQLVAPLLYYMDAAFDKHYEVALEQQNIYKAKLADIEKNSEELEDDFYLLKKVPEDVYIRLRTKLAKEKADIAEILSTLDVESFNLKTYFREGINISTQLATSWASSQIPVKEKLQKFIFLKESPIIAKKAHF